MPYLFYVLAIILIVATITTFLLLIRKKTLSLPENLKEANQKSFEILHEAINQSKNILGTAELESIRITADSKFALKRLDQEFQRRLEEYAGKSEKTLDQALLENQQAIISMQQDFAKYLEHMKLLTEQSQEQQKEVIRSQLNVLFEKFEQNLSTFLTQTEQESVKSIELELKAARGLIESYKNQQLAIVDENVIAILEKTLSLVLAKKLTLNDQLDLVYEALEKAKVEKFIV